MADGKANIGPRISIEGEKEYRNSISNLNKDMKVLTSEMKAVSAEFDGNANSIDALTKKSSILEKEYESQIQKIQVLRDALENAKTQYGENSNQVKDWQIKLNTANAELSSLDKEIKTNNKYLDEAKSSTDGTAKSIDEFGKKAKDADKSTDEMSDSVNEFGVNIKDAGKNTLTTGDIIKANLAGAAVVGGVKTLGLAIKGLGESTLGFAADSTKAFNSLVSKTGAAESEFKELQSVMNSIYADNFGESIEDVADAMAIVKQQTGLANNELKETTEQALLMRDTFDFDISESIRSVKMLMDQFGLSSEESFNLIAQGAQGGLDKNGDLLDSINEYSVHFKNLGLDANDMFNSLKNGADTGTFSVDKLGDAVKEFGIRVKDGTADTAFKKLGLDVSETTKAFGTGGDKAKEALQKVSNALFNMEDPIEQNILGVTLFGTQWEDLGSTGIKALTNLNGSISTTSQALDNINKQKYKDLGSAFDAIGRQLQVSIAEPITEKLTPAIDGFMLKLEDNAPKIQKAVGGIAEGFAEGLGWFVENSDVVIAGLSGISAAMITQASVGVITNAVGAFQTLSTAIKTATTAQELFNLAQKSNAIGLLVTAVAGLGTALYAYSKTQNKTTSEFEELEGRIRSVREENEKFSNDLKSSEKNYTDNTREIKGNADALALLSEKLYDLADKENKTNSEKAQMQSIINQLNASIPELNLAMDEQTGIINRQEGEVDNLIQTMKEKALMQAHEERYLELANEQVAAQERLTEATNKQTEAENAKAKAEENYLAQLAKHKDGESWKGIYDAVDSMKQYSDALDIVTTEVENTQKILDESKIKFNEFDEQMKDTSESTEENAEVTAKANKEITLSLSEVEAAYKKSKQTAIDSIESQINIFDKFNDSQKVSKDELLKNLKSQVEGVTNWANNLKELSNRGINEGLLADLKEMGPSAAQEIAALNSMSDKELVEYSNTWEKLGKATVKGAEIQVSETKETYDKAYKEQQAAALKAGEKQVESLNTGIKNKQTDLEKRITEVLENSLKYANNSTNPKAKAVGVAITDGIKLGATEQKNSLGVAMTGLADIMLSSFKERLGIHSPSKVMKDEVGVQIAQGVIDGVESKKENAKKSASELGEIILNSAKSKLDNYKVYNSLSLKEEVEYWNQIKQEVKKGTQARIDADKEYYDAKKTLNEKQADIEKTYKDNVVKTNDELQKSIDSLRKTYTDAVEARTKAITGSMGLFDSFSTSTNVSGTELLDNLKSQVSGLQTWGTALNSLEARGLDRGLLKELQNLGIDATGEIIALNSMTDEQLNEYVKLWNERGKEASTIAKNELSDMKKSVNKDIKELTKQAEKDLNAYYKTYTIQLKELSSSVSKDSRIIGENITKGIVSGVKAQENALKDAVTGVAKGALNAAKAALGIHSPSTVFRDEVGRYMAQGLGEGFVGEMDHVMQDINNSIPTDFEINGAVNANPVNSLTNGINMDYLTSTVSNIINNMKLSAKVEAPFIIGTQEFGRAVIQVQVQHDEIYNPTPS